MSAPVLRGSEALADLDRIHAKLMAAPVSPELLVQVHEFLDIDPDIADRVYPPMPNARPGVYPNTCSRENYDRSVQHGYVDLSDCEPTPAPKRPVEDVQTGGVL